MGPITRLACVSLSVRKGENRETRHSATPTHTPHRHTSHHTRLTPTPRCLLTGHCWPGPQGSTAHRISG
eukprot:4485681-Prymnesium_polylepis.2